MSVSMMSSNNSFRDLDLLPQFPGIATKMLRVLSHNDAGVQEIAGLVRADAALSAELLRIVNSPLFAFPSRIKSIQQAIMICGFEEIRKFVLAVSVKSFLKPAMRLDLLRAVWRHSLACATVCEELSTACSATMGPDDRAYTAGLLHDIGRLGLFVVHPSEYAALLQGTDENILERESLEFGVNHCEAGAWLAQKWELPEELQRTAATHHQTPEAPGTDLERLVRIGVLLTGMLGFDVPNPKQPCSLRQIRTMLPREAQYRFDPDPNTMRARVAHKLDAFD